MNTESLGRLFQLLLLGSGGASLASACGGSVVSIEDPGGSPSGRPSGTSTPEDRPGTVPPTRRPDAGRDALPDVREASLADVLQPTCLYGELDPDDTLCCKNPPGPGCISSGDPKLCALDCGAVCEKVAPGLGMMQSCYWTASATAPKISYYCGACGVGRVPSDLEPCTPGRALGERLAMQAYYEAASVVAFERLASVLQASGAPAHLVEAARRAAEEERRHASRLAGLAEARGSKVRAPELSPRALSLFEIALENASEGCVRETYGALVALHQAAHAEDEALRAAFREIAAEETSHAAFSWELATWLDARLTAAERAAVASAHEQAKRALRPGASFDETDLAFGLPEASRGQALFDGLFASLPAAVA